MADRRLGVEESIPADDTSSLPCLDWVTSFRPRTHGCLPVRRVAGHAITYRTGAWVRPGYRVVEARVYVR